MGNGGMRNGLALILLGTSLIASSALAQGTGKGDSSGAYVRVSREEVRVYFPPETSSAWGTARAPSDDQTLLWVAPLEGDLGTARLELRSRVDNTSHSLPSLEAIVREGRRSFCRVLGMDMYDCSSAYVSASLENRRIVLGFRDTLEIRQIFGPHPLTVSLLRIVPADLMDISIASAPVHYVDPPIVVDSRQRAALVEARRRREASINRYHRQIVDGSQGWQLWLVVGDSLELAVQDFRCHIDLCGSYDDPGNGPRDWGQWSVSDSSIATLHRSTRTRADSYAQLGYDPGPTMILVAARPGRLKVRATGVHTPADTMPSGTPLDSILEREVIVTRPVARVMISPRPRSMIAGSPMAFTARVLDRAGRTIEGPFIDLKWDTNVSATSPSKPVTVTFTQPGRHWVAASLGTYTDSVMVDVRPPASSP